MTIACMGWQTTDDLVTFLTAADGFLRARPAEHTALLSVCAALRAGTRRFGEDAPAYGWWEAPDGTAGGAFLHTPPRPVLLSRMPDEAAAGLEAFLAEAGHPFTGVNGGRAAAETVAAARRQRTGERGQIVQTQRLYRLAGLVPPEPAPPGRARVATAADRALLVDWYTAFGHEAGTDLSQAASAVDDRLAYGGLMLWEADGVPVSMAGFTRTVAGMVRVGPVYTPPALRGRGYAGAATAAVSEAVRAAGAAEILLFADVANATSSALYRRLGYRPVEDNVVLSFAPAPAPASGRRHAARDGSAAPIGQAASRRRRPEGRREW